MSKLLNWIPLHLLLILSPFIFAQEIRETPLKGKPRFVLEESFEGKLEKNSLIKTGKDRQISWMNDNKREFDRNGNLVKRSYFDDYREFIHAEEYEFENHRLSKKKYLSFVYTYNYDSRGNLVEEMLAPIGDSSAKKIKHRYAYDLSNRLTNVWEYDFQGGQIFHQSNTYNNLGFLAKELYEYVDGNEYIKFNYDINNNLIKKEWFDEFSGIIERNSYTYVNGILVTELWEGLEKNKVETSTKYEYDQKGNTISVLDVNPKRQIHDHEVNKYTFDDKGNWVKKTTVVNNSRFYIVERIIAYY